MIQEPAATQHAAPLIDTSGQRIISLQGHK